MTILFAIFFSIAAILLVGTMIISVLKSLQRSRFPEWTFLDYISVGYLKYLYTRYVLKK